MNRQEEFNRLIDEDVTIPDSLNNVVKTQVQKYYHHQKIKNYFYKPVLSLVCMVMTMITVFNLFPSTAYACKDIPVLEILAKAFCYDKAVLECINNDYGLYLNEQSQDITLEYMIADEAQISFYFSMNQERDPDEITDNVTFVKKGQHMISSIYNYDSDYWNIQILYDDIKNVEFDDQLTFTLNDRLYTFDIPLDKLKIQPRKVFEINQEMNVHGQKFTIDKLELHPSISRLYVSLDKDNTMILNELIINITQGDKHFTNKGSGVTSVGDTQRVYMFESPYFHNKDFTVSIDQTSFIDRKKCKVDIQNKTIQSLPEKVKLTKFEIKDNEMNIGLSAPYINTAYTISNHYYENNKKIRFSEYRKSIYSEKGYFEEFITIPYDSHKTYEIEVDDYIYYDMNEEIKIEQKN